MVYDKYKRFPVEQKDTPAGAGGLTPPLYLLRVRDTDSGQTITSKIIAKR